MSVDMVEAAVVEPANMIDCLDDAYTNPVHGLAEEVLSVVCEQIDG